MRKIIFALLLACTVCNAQEATECTIRYKGQEHTYYLYIPSSAGEKCPLVMVLHGYGGKAQGYRPEMMEVAAEEGFALCYPQGETNSVGKTGWNVGYPSQADLRSDDIAYIRFLAKSLVKKHGFSTENVFLSGMSNGGEMCYLLAYTHPEKFAAIVSLAGLTMEWIYRDVKPRGPIPFVEIHGTADKTSHWEGDPDNHDGWGEYIAVPHAIGRMISLDCCTHEVCDTLPLYKPGSNTVVRHRYLDGTDGAEVRLYEIIGGLHKNGSADMDVPEVLWEFFSGYMK